MSPHPQRSALTVADLMATSVTSVTPDTTVGEALNKFYEQKLSALPVVEDNRCVGIVTASDLVVLIRALDQTLQSEYPHFEDCLWAVELVQRKCDQDSVREIMSEAVVTARPDDTAADAAGRMVAESVHHLPVVQNDRLVGFLSMTDFVRQWNQESNTTESPTPR